MRSRVSGRAREFCVFSTQPSGRIKRCIEKLMQESTMSCVEGHQAGKIEIHRVSAPWWRRLVSPWELVHLLVLLVALLFARRAVHLALREHNHLQDVLERNVVAVAILVHNAKPVSAAPCNDALGVVAWVQHTATDERVHVVCRDRIEVHNGQRLWHMWAHHGRLACCVYGHVRRHRWRSRRSHEWRVRCTGRLRQQLRCCGHGGQGGHVWQFWHWRRGLQRQSEWRW